MRPMPVRAPRPARPRRTVTRTLLLLAFAASGCAKSMSATRMDYAGSAPMAPPADGDMMKESEREYADDAPMPSGAPAPVMPSEEMAMPEPRPTSTPAEPAVEDVRKDLGGRMIIYTAGMRIAVFNLEEAMTKAESLPEKFGGYVHSMGAGELVLKIPARKLRAAMTELGGYGVVEQKSLNTQDVSAEYVDIESRIRALESTHKQLLELLSKARTVDEALHVRQALDQVGAELEVLKGRMRQLDSLISFSTLTVSLYERGPHTPTPSSNDPFPWVDSLGVEATEWK